MFRRKASTLPQDVVFPKILEELGYFVNDQDQIRQIKAPDQRYIHKANRSERVNDMYREAMNTCVSSLAKARLRDLGFQTLRLPLGAGATDNHVPIYLSAGIKQKKRIIVYFPERQVDPVVHSYRLTGDECVNEGTVINMVKGIMNGTTATSHDNAPGLIIANASQLFWYRGGQRAVTWYEWLNLPRPSAVSPCYRVDPEKNLVPGNVNSKEHVQYVFENVLTGDQINTDAKLDIIGLEWTSKEVVEYLAANWATWSHRVSSICFSCPQHKINDLFEQDAPQEFIDFISKKCRAYFVSTLPQGAVVEGRPEFGCNCYSSGDDMYTDQVLSRAWPAVLDHFNAVHTLENYEEIERYAPKELEPGDDEEMPN